MFNSVIRVENYISHDAEQKNSNTQNSDIQNKHSAAKERFSSAHSANDVI